ncbi:MAG TPA: amidohydrolase family protein, partial [Actinomycetota bacterium]|nr:amidohydrolase family protein [Actinomycetota bacterium]
MTTLFTGGPIRTGAGDRVADWVTVEGDRILGVGMRDDMPSADHSVDLGGATLVTAFRDAHVHLPATGLYATGLDFRGETSAAAITRAFAARASSGGDPLLFGGNFEDPLDEPLEGAQLDAAVGERPALLARADMHSAIVSSALLAQLDVGDLQGVDRDAEGRPTGYLREQAAAEAWRWFDANLSKEQQRDAVTAAVRLAYSKGVVEVHEMFVVEWRGWNAAEAFAEIIEPFALDVRLFLGTDDVDRVRHIGHPRIGGDYFLDGSFGSHTAWMQQPFVSLPSGGSPATGISYRDDDHLLDFFLEAQSAGLQVGVHAIGDAAI